MRIEIFRGHAGDILCAAQGAFPDECCGLLLGSAERIVEVVPAPNVADDKGRHFEVDPVVLLATFRRARKCGLQLLGSYHSHPGGTAVPSATDAEKASESLPLWLIASPPQLTAWKWHRDRGFEAIDLVVFD